MEAKDWIAIVGILATTLVSVTTLTVNWLREKQRLDREAALEEKKRTYSPHIEFEITCHFYGSQKGNMVAEFLLTARNKGLIRQEFRNIIMRVRGIEQKKDLSCWSGHEPRLDFPIELVDDVSLLPPGYNYFFIEPGIEQVFTYVTKIPSSVAFILAHAAFEYDRFTPHTTERVFTVNPGG